MARKERWTPTPAPHDFGAAADYLSLLFDDATVAALVGELRSAPMTTRKAKDLLRASRLELLDARDHEVRKDLRKVKKGTRLSPVLLVRGDASSDRPLTIADGYHRICASYQLDEDAAIPCRIVDVRPRATAAPRRERRP